jgi:CDP-diacylglycerol--glycerol-3-phosphate 3-phosphatidyltransferase
VSISSDPSSPAEENVAEEISVTTTVEEPFWEPVIGIPNVVTMVRAGASLPVAAYAVAEHSAIWLAVAYAIYWIGDIADGWLARKLDRMTRIGAVLDIVSDRVGTGVCAVGLIVLRPELWPVVSLFLFSFMIVDTMLSLAFLRWPILTPNHFDRVDPLIWRWNWWPPAKALNTAGVVLALVLGGEVVAFVLAAVVLGIKVWSLRRLITLPATAGPDKGPA